MQRLLIETPGQDQKVMAELYQDIQRRIAASPLGLCPVDISLNFLRTCYAQSCGKCVPCRIGLGQLAIMFEKILDGECGLEILDQIAATAQTITDTADCAIGYEAARMVLRSLKGFYDDYHEHIINGKCIYGLEHAIPCSDVCPAHVDVPGYIALTRAGRYEDALRLIRKDNPFPSVCAYVCEHPCETHCRRQMVDDAVNICGIKRYAVDHAGQMAPPACAPKTGKRIAIVGGGPGGLTTAYFLTLMGHTAVVYERHNKLGGMLRYGIPDYRLPAAVLEKDIQYILGTGVEVKTDTEVGTDVRLEELKADYDAVYISIGAHDDRKLGIEGEESVNVISAVKMLRDMAEGQVPDLKGKRVCVVGGGNVAMDAVRTSLRLGAGHVTCIYRRRIEDMTALAEEVEQAQREGSEILQLHAPVRIETDESGAVNALWVQPQIISQISQDGRPAVRAASRAAVRIPCDYLIVAIGQTIESKYFEERGIRTKRGTIKAERSSYVPESGNVFAGGDAVSGPATVIRAVAAGKVAADNIDNFLGFHHVISTDVAIPAPQLTNSPACGRINLKNRSIETITGNFELADTGMTEEEAFQECERCLRCDHFGFGNFKGGRSFLW